MPWVDSKTTEMHMNTGCQLNMMGHPSLPVLMVGDRTATDTTMVDTTARMRTARWAQNCHVRTAGVL